MRDDELPERSAPIIQWLVQSGHTHKHIHTHKHKHIHTHTHAKSISIMLHPAQRALHLKAQDQDQDTGFFHVRCCKFILFCPYYSHVWQPPALDTCCSLRARTRQNSIVVYPIYITLHHLCPCFFSVGLALIVEILVYMDSVNSSGECKKHLSAAKIAK